jgi:serine/threonine protein kinase
VSDFGIASFPGKPSLTSASRKLGPLHFIAPEMLNAPEKSDGAKADVYSLAKTLWVLLTGQKYPPPGEHHHDIEQLQIGRMVKLRESSALDNLMEEATRYDSAKRISMKGFHQMLKDWLPKKAGGDASRDLR